MINELVQNKIVFCHVNCRPAEAKSFLYYYQKILWCHNCALSNIAAILMILLLGRSVYVPLVATMRVTVFLDLVCGRLALCHVLEGLRIVFWNGR